MLEHTWDWDPKEDVSRLLSLVHLVKAVPQHHTEEQHTFASVWAPVWLSAAFTGKDSFIYSDRNIQVTVKEILKNKETIFHSFFIYFYLQLPSVLTNCELAWPDSQFPLFIAKFSGGCSLSNKASLILDKSHLSYFLLPP